MRHIYVVSYDISDPKRLRRVYKHMLGYGDHIQLSVFRCELTDTERVELRRGLEEIIHRQQDQILFIHLGPVLGRASRAIASLGRVYDEPERQAVIV